MNDDPTAPGPFSASYRRWLLLLLLLITSFSFMDRVIVQVLGQAIKEDFGLTDFQLGLLSGLSFAAFYSLVGFPIARFAERRSRISIMSISVAIFSVMAALTGLAVQFWQLIICRAGVGIGEAGVQPPGVSLIGDHFERAKRGSAIAIMQLGSPLGSFIGAFGGGWFAHIYGWRAALVAIAVPGLIVSAIFRLTLREPPRGMSDPGPGPRPGAIPPPFISVLRLLWSKPQFRHMLAGLALATTALYGSGAFLAPFFFRVFDMGIAKAAAMYAVISGVATLIGLSLSGFGIDWLGRRNAQWYALLPALGLSASVPLYLVGYTSATPYVALTLITLASTFMFCFQTPTIVAFQNMVDSRMRASAAFIYLFTSALIGVGAGPPLMGLSSDFFARRAFDAGNFALGCPGGKALPGAGTALVKACAAASAMGVRRALITMACVFLWAAAHYFVAAYVIRREGGRADVLEVVALDGVTMSLEDKKKSFELSA